MKKILLLVSVMLLFINCGSNSTIVSSWKDPNANAEKEAFNKVLIVALFKDVATRNRIEDRIANSNPIFKKPSIPLDKTAVGLSPEEKAKILKSEGFDGVVAMRLVDVAKEVDYVPGNTMSYYDASFNGYYGGHFGGWYNYYGTTFYDPGYYVENTAYYVETNVFSLKQNKLIWSGTTKTMNAIDDIEGSIQGIITEVVTQMKKDGFLKSDKK